MQIAVAGSTGLVGKSLIQQLTEALPDAEIHLYGRKTAGFAKIERLHEHIVDFEQLEKLNSQTSIDKAFCCLGTTIKKAGSKENFKKVDYEFVLNFARMAKKAGAKEFHLVSAIGSDANSPFFYSQVKGEVEKALADLKFDVLVIYHPSLLLGNREEFRMGERLAILGYPFLEPLLLGPLANYKAIEAKQVAKAMIKKSQLNLPKGLYIVSNLEMLKN